MGRRGRSIFGNQGNTFFITTTVVNFDPILSCGDTYYLILIDSLRHVLEEHHATLFAYVLMPSHVHIIIAMPEGESISDLMRDFKKFTSTKIRQQLEKDNQTSWILKLKANAATSKEQVFKLWMDRFDDVVIFSEKVLRQKIEYIHYNPVKAGLVEKPEDWKYSSARNYILDDHNLICVATDWELVSGENS